MGSTPGYRVERRAAIRLATLISNVIQPGVVTYITLFVLLWYYRSNLLQFIILYLVCATLMVTIPTLYVLSLFRRNRIEHLFIPNRHDRTNVYLLTAGLCLICYLFLRLVVGPTFVAGMVFAIGVNTLVMAVVNLFWKISGHAAGLTAPLMALCLVYGWATAPLFVLVPLVAWARVVLGAHTFAQVIFGSLLGLGLTWLQLSWLLPQLHLM